MKTRTITGILLITVLVLGLLGTTPVSAKNSSGDGDNQQNKGKPPSNDQGDQDKDKDRPCGDKIPVGWYKDPGNPWD